MCSGRGAMLTTAVLGYDIEMRIIHLSQCLFSLFSQKIHYLNY